MPGILYMTDQFGISKGYEPAFTKMVHKAGIPRNRIVPASIYNLVEKPLKKKANENVWRFDPEKLGEITTAFDQRISAIRPDLIVVSCPAVLGCIANGDSRIATLAKMRGGVYSYRGITCIVTYPVTAIHHQIDSRIVANEDGEQDTQTPYRVQQGAQILAWDWQKISRFFHSKQRKLPPFSYSICRSIRDCAAARDYLSSAVLISCDIETGNFPPQITCVGYTGLMPNGSCHSFVIPFYDEFKDGGVFWPALDDHQMAWGIVREINDSPVPKTFQNGSYDCSYFIRDRAPVKNFLLDSMVLWWSKYMELPKSLDFITSVLLDNYQYWKDDIKGDDIESVAVGDRSTERYWRYNALDCYNTLWNTVYLLAIMSKDSMMQTVYRDAFMRLISGLQMSMRGMAIDNDKKDYHRNQLIKDRDEATAKLRYILADNGFNINSPAQKCSLLYDFFGLRPRNAKGRFVNFDKPLKAPNTPSAGAIPIKLAKTEHPLFRYILEILEAAMTPDKQMSNVTGKIDPETGKVTGGITTPNNRFQTAFNPVGTETTRFSSKRSNFWNGGNAQNIRDKYRDWIVADPDHILLDIDYSQSDDVFVAYESEDPDKIEVVESGLDAHAVNGELFFGKTYAWIVEGKEKKDPLVVHPVKGVRQISKRVVHGTNFQMAGMTLYVTMGREAVVAAAELLGFPDAGSWDQDRLVQLCQQLMGKYRRKYKRLTSKEWYSDIVKELRSTGKMVNAFGIGRQFLGDPDDNGTQREATAFIGQSDTAGNMNRVMAEIDLGFIPKAFRDGPNPHADDEPRRMTWDSHGFGFHLQVHDNFVAQLNTKHPLWRTAAHNLLYVMDRPVIIKGRSVRIRAEASVGLRWGKNVINWNGDMNTLDSCVQQLREGDY